MFYDKSFCYHLFYNRSAGMDVLGFCLRIYVTFIFEIVTSYIIVNSVFGFFCFFFFSVWALLRCHPFIFGFCDSQDVCNNFLPSHPPLLFFFNGQKFQYNVPGSEHIVSLFLCSFLLGVLWATESVFSCLAFVWSSADLGVSWHFESWSSWRK